MQPLLVTLIVLVALSNGQAVLLQQMEQKTGLMLTVRDSQLTEIGEITDANGNLIGSKTAREDLRAAMAPGTTFVIEETTTGTDMGLHQGSVVSINMDQIDKVNTGKNAAGTLDASMIVFHELLGHGLHGFSDPRPFVYAKFPDAKGDAVRYDNVIRTELGLPLRSQYRTQKDSTGRYYIPFDDGRVYVPEPPR